MSGRTLDIQANDKQRAALIAWNDEVVDDVVFGGAAGGGKSFLAGLALTMTALQYQGCKLFLGRKELKTLMLSSYITLTQKVFPVFGLKHEDDWKLDGKYNVIHFKNGSTINLLDLIYQPSDPLYDRFGSQEYTRGWIEEASEVDFKAYDVLKSRVGRHNHFGDKVVKSKLGLSLNPSQEWPYRLFYAPWKKAGMPNTPIPSMSVMMEGKLVERKFIFVQSLYKDNPFTAEEYGRNLATISDPVLKQRLMDGNWEYTSANDTLFDAQSIADLYTNNVPTSYEQYLTVDVARYGGDRIVLTHWKGLDAFKVDHYTNLSVVETAEKVRNAMDMYGIPRENTLIDADGIGGGVVDMLPGVLSFNGGASPFGEVGEVSRKENYENLKTQCAYHMGELTKARKVRVSETNFDVKEFLSQELAQVRRRDGDKDGKLKIVRKEEMKQALGRSPDFADTFIMRAYFDLRLRDVKTAWMSQTITVTLPE